MADGRKNNGGARAGAGRKPKADEIKLIEKLDSQFLFLLQIYQERFLLGKILQVFACT